MKHTLTLIFTIILLMTGLPSRAQYLIKYNSYYSYGHQTINKSEISAFLKENCAEAYEQYHNKNLKIGWGICVPSIAMLVGGAVMSCMYKAGDYIAYTGIGLGVAGAVGIIVSTPILAIGYDKRKRSCDVFNNQCVRYASSTPLMLNFKAGPQSIGMALMF